jgi:hypothetical protein
MAKHLEGFIGGENEELLKKRGGRPKVDSENRLILKNVPAPLMEWIKGMAADSYRTPEGQILFTLTGCMNANLAKKEQGGGTGNGR